jgi:hypothetical protein
MSSAADCHIGQAPTLPFATSWKFREGVFRAKHIIRHAHSMEYLLYFFKKNYATLKFDLPATISLRALLLGTQGCRGVLLVDMWGRTSDCTVLKLKRQGKKAKASAFHSHV